MAKIKTKTTQSGFFQRFFKPQPRVKTRRPRFQLEAMEPRIYLAAADLTNATVQTRIGEMFTHMETMGASLNTDSKTIANAPLVDLDLSTDGIQFSANDLFSQKFGDYVRGGTSAVATFKTAAVAYFAGDASDTFAELVTALDARADAMMGAGTWVTGSSAANIYTIAFNFDTASAVTKTGYLNLGGVGQDLDMGIGSQIGLTDPSVTVSATRDINFSFVFDLSNDSALTKDKFELDVQSYRAQAIVDVNTGDNRDFGIQIGVLGARSNVADANSEGAWVDNMSLDVNLTVDVALANPGVVGARLSILEADTAVLASLPLLATSAPVGDDPKTVPVETTTNKVNLTLPVKVQVKATGSNFSGLSGIAASVVLTDADVTDGAGAILDATSTGVAVLRNFGNMTAENMLATLTQFADWSKMFSGSSLYDTILPLVDTRMGSAFDFNKAFNDVLLAQLQTSEYVLVGQRAAASFNAANTASFVVSTTSANRTVNLTGPYADLATLVAAINTALAGFAVQARINNGQVSRIEFYGTEAFIITGILDTDTINLGFNNYNYISVTPPSNATGTTLPSVIVGSSSAMTVSDFSSASGGLQFNVVIQRASGGALNKNVMLGAANYQNLGGLQLAIRTALINQGLLIEGSADGSIPEKGMTVRMNAANNGLEFVALENTHQIQLNEVSGRTDLATYLKVSNGTTSTATYLDIAVNGGAATRVYLNGNITNGVLGLANKTLASDGIVDLVNDLRKMLKSYGALSQDGNTGIDVRSSGTRLEFYAVNAGTGTGQTNAFTVAASTGVFSTLGFASNAAVTGTKLNVSSKSITPKFNSIQQLADLLSTNGFLTSEAQYVKTGSTMEVYFPVKFGLTLSPVTGKLVLGSNTGELNTVTTTSTVSITPVVDVAFDLGFKLDLPVATAQTLSIMPSNGYVDPAGLDLTVAISDGNTALNNWNGVLTNDAVFRIRLDDGIERTVTVDKSSTTDNTDLGTAASPNAANTLVADINTAIRAVAGLMSGAGFANQKVQAYVVASTSADTSDRIELRLNTAVSNSTTMSVMADPTFTTTPANAAVGTLATGLGIPVGTTAGTGSPSSWTASNTNSLPSNGKLTTDATFTLQWQNGAPITVTVLASETSTNTTIDELIDDINFSIRNSGVETMKGGFGYAFQIVQASKGGSGSNQLVLSINSSAAVTTSNSLSVTTTATNTLVTPNAAASELGFPENRFTETSATLLKVVSDQLAILNMTGSGNGVFTLSLDSGASVTVTIPEANYADIGALVTAFNTALTTAGLSTKVRAIQFGQSDRVGLVIIDSTVNSIRFLANTSTNSIVTKLGFPSNDLFARRYGVQEYINNAVFNAKATVSSAAIGLTANLGMVAFQTGGGSKLDFVANTRSILEDSSFNRRFSLNTLATAVVSQNTSSVAKFATVISESNSAVSTLGFAATQTDNTNNPPRLDSVSSAPLFGRLTSNALFKFSLNGLTNELVTLLSSATSTNMNVGDLINDLNAAIRANSNLMSGGSAFANQIVQAINVAGKVRFQINTAVSASTFLTLATDSTYIDPANSSFAKLTLDNLALSGTAVTGLAFGANARIVYDAEVRNAGALQPFDLKAINALTMNTSSTQNLNNIDKMVRLSFDDIVSGLRRSAESFSDYMAHSPVGQTATVFGKKLPFVDFSLLEMVDFGAEFKTAIEDIANNPPRTLQELESRLELGLGLSGAALTVSLANLASGNDITLQINADWKQNYFASLPLFIDLGKLGAAWGNSPLVSQELGISAIATGFNNLVANFSALGKLNLDMGVKITDSVGTKTTPQSFLYDSSRMDIDMTLSAPNLNLDIPVGAATIKIVNGGIALNLDGSVLTNDPNGIQTIVDPAAFGDGVISNVVTQARVATTSALVGTLSGGVLTSTSNESLNSLGIEVANLVVGDRILLMTQGQISSAKTVENGVYVITSLGSGASQWVLTRATDANTAAELNNLVISVTSGKTYGGKRFRQVDNVVTLDSNSVSFSRLVDPMQMSLDVSGNQNLAWGAKVATTANLSATYNNGTFGVGATLTASAVGSINNAGIDGYSQLVVGDKILVKNQTTASQNGIYLVKSLGSTTAAWVLERGDFADTSTEVNGMKVSVEEGELSGNKRFIQTANLSAIGTGNNLVFSNSLTAVSTGFASTPVTGEGIANLPMQLTTRNQNNELVTLNLGALVVSINNDKAAPNYSGMQRYLDESIGSSIQAGVTLNSVGVDSTSINIVADDATDTFISNAHGLVNGDRVTLSGANIPTGVAAATVYYVVNTTANTFQLSASTGGAAIAVSNTAAAVTIDPSTDLITLSAHGLSNGDTVSFTGTMPPELVAGTLYYVVNATTGTFKVASTSGGLAIDLTTAGTSVGLLRKFVANKDYLTYAAHGLNNGDRVIIKGTVIPDGLQTNLQYYVVNADANRFQLALTLNGSPVSITSNGTAVRVEYGFFYTVNFENLPPLADNIPNTDVLRLLRDPIMLADSLDLSLFNLQFAMDFNTGTRNPLVGTQLTDFTQYIEAFRPTLTNAIRNDLRGDILNPLDTVRDTLWNIMGSDAGGMGYLTGSKFTAITAYTVDASGVSTAWDWSADHDSDDDGIDEMPNNAVAIEYGFNLRKKAVVGFIDDVDLAVPNLGFSPSPAGDGRGVNIQSYFAFDMRFGLSLSDGFYLVEGASNEITLNFAAVLDNDITTLAIEDFAQTGYVGRMYDLTVKAVDKKGVPISFNLGDGTLINGGQSGFYGSYGFKLNDGDASASVAGKRLTITEQYGKRPTQLVTATLNGDIDINLALQTKHSVASDMTLDWHLDQRFGTGAAGSNFAGLNTTTVGASPDPSSMWKDANGNGTYDAGENTGRDTELEAEMLNIKVDLITAFTKVFKPFFDKISEVMAPFEPMIDFLTTDLPFISTVLGRSFTVLDLAAAFGYVNPAAMAAIKAVKYIKGLIDQASAQFNISGSQIGANSTINQVPVGSSRSVGLPLKGSTLGDEQKGRQEFEKLSKSQKFDKGTKSYDDYKKAAAQAKGDVNKSKTKAVAGMQGGGVFIGLFDPNEVVKLLIGQPANIVLLDLPKFSLGLSYEKRFPIPPVPVLQGKLFASVTAFIDLGFGWDTEGFYMADVGNNGTMPTAGASTAGLPDVPEFGLTFTLGIGGSVNLAFIEAGIEATFTVEALINWNDPNNDGKIRESERQILRTLSGGGLNEVDITITGSFDVTIYVDVFAIFDWARVFEYSFGPWEVFRVTFAGNDPSTIPARQLGDILVINIGPNASSRIFPNIIDGDERVTLTSVGGSSGAGENIQVRLDWLPGAPTATYNGIRKVIAIGGAGDDTIDARSLQYAVVDLDGGDGNDVLYAGAVSALSSAGNRNIIRGGAGNDKIYGSRGYDWLIGGAGNDQLIAYDTTTPGTDVGDILDGGFGTDILDGGRGADNYIFENNWGRDRLVEQNDVTTNTMDFTRVTTNMEYNLGRILYSATSGANVMFADPGLFSRIDSGSGSDRFNVSNFFAGQTLVIDGRNGSDFYAINLGDPNPPGGLAGGAVNLLDSGSVGTDTLLLLPTRADEFEASLSYVVNGRESMTNVGLERFLIDAGSFTIRLGNAGSPGSWADLGQESVINAGRIKLLSHVEAGSINWNLTNGMTIDRHINARNNGSIRISIANPDPGSITPLDIGNASYQVQVTSSKSSIMLSSSPQIYIPGTSSVVVSGIVVPSSSFNFFGFTWATSVTTSSATTVQGLGSVSLPPVANVSGVPGFNATGRPWTLVAGRSEFYYDGIWFPWVPDFWVPGVSDFVYTSTLGPSGSAAFTIPAVADVWVPGVYGPGGRNAVLIPGRGAVTVAATLPATGTKVVTPDPATDTFSAVDHGYENGDRVTFMALSGALPTNITASTNYYIINSGSNTFQVSATSGGAAVDVASVGGTIIVSPVDTLANVGGGLIVPGFQDGNGRGLIKLSNLNGSILNVAGTTGGLIQATNGSIGLQAKYNIGKSSDRILVNSQSLAVETRDAVVGGQIYLKSTRDVNLVSIDGIQGASTALGDIDILLSAGKTLYSERIQAGSLNGVGGNIVLTADEINLQSQRSYTAWYWWYWRWWSGGYQVTTWYDVPTVSGVTITMQSATAGLTTNVGNDVPLGGDTNRSYGSENSTAGLDISGDVFNGSRWVRGDLAALANGFQRITIGREDSNAGVTNLYGHAFNDSLTVRGGEVNLIAGTGNITVTGVLDALVVAGTAGSGNINVNSGTGAITADGMTWAAKDNINVNRAVTSTVANSSMTFSAGQDGSGSVTVSAALTVSGTNSDLALTAGSSSGNITLNADLNVNDLIQLTAAGGSIIVNSVNRLNSNVVTATANTTLTLYTNTNTINATTTGAGNILINEFNGVLLNTVVTANGDIAITTGGATLTGDIRTTEGAVIRAGDIIITAAGTLGRNNNSIQGNLITLTASGAIGASGNVLMTRAIFLDVSATAAGGIYLSEFDGVELTDIDTSNGLIEIEAAGSIDARDVQSLTNSDANDITLTVTAGTGGSITADIIIATGAGDITLLSDGAVLDYTLGTGKIQSDQLIVEAIGVVNLDTQVSTLDARTTGSGDMTVTEVNGLTIADLRGADSRGLQTLTGNITLNVGGDLTLQSDVFVATPYDVIINAGTGAGNGFINRTSGTIFGDVITLTAEGYIIANTSGATLNATASTAGAITLVETDSAILNSILSFDGVISIQVGSAGTGGNATLNVITAGTDGAGAVDNVNLNVFGSIAQTTGKVTGNNLVVDSRGTTTLLTNVATLNASVLVAGFLNVTEDNTINLLDVDTFNGPIIMTAGGQLTATIVRSLLDDDANDISLTTTSGNILLGMISAGTGLGDVTLVSASQIQEIGAGDAAVDVIGDFLTFTSAGAQGGTAELDIETTALIMDLTVTGAGAMYFTETDAVELRDIDTANGLITFVAGGTITATDVESTTDNDANDITITTTAGDILVNRITAGTVTSGATAGDMFLTAAGVIEETVADAGADLIADNAVLVSNSGSIGGAVAIETSFNNLTAHANNNLVVGNIVLNETNAIQLDDIDTANGSITLVAGGNITAVDVQSLTDADANDILLTNTAGSINVGFISAGTTAGDITLTSNVGAIVELNSGDGVDLIADVLNITAFGNIGTTAVGMQLETTVVTANINSTSLGSIVFDETNGIILNSVVANNGLITMNANGQVTATSVISTTDNDANDITLHSTTGDILVNLINAGTANGDIFLTADAGNIEETNPEDVSIDLTADYGTLVASGSIGGVRPIETRFNFLTGHSNTAGNVSLNEFDNIQVDDLDTANGSITLTSGGTVTALDIQSLTDADANDITITAVNSILIGVINAGPGLGDVAGGDIILTATTGNILETGAGDAGADLLSDNAILTAGGSIGTTAAGMQLETTFNTLIASSTSVGSIVITETNAITLTDVDTQNGLITFITGGNLTALDVQSLTDNDANDITFTVTGNIAFDLVSGNGTSTTGATAGDVFMTASGSIEENIADAGADLIGDNSILIANGGSIGGVVSLETSLNTLTAHSNAAGAIVVNETNDIQLDDVDTANGLITFTSGGTLTAIDVQSLTDNDANDITITAANSILIGVINAGPGLGDVAGGDIILTATTGNILETGAGDAGADLLSDYAILTAGGSIGTTAAGMQLETTFNTLNASSTSVGSIVITETNAITLTDVDTQNGLITFITGGNLTALDVQSLTDNDANDITFTATGNIAFDLVSGNGTSTTGATAGDVFMTASGSIEENIADAGPDLIGDNSILIANGGSIGGVVDIESALNTLTAHSNAAGAIVFNEVNAIQLDDIDTANGLITFNAGGTISAVDVQSLTDADVNDVTLNSTGGDILVNFVSAGPLNGDLLFLATVGNINELGSDGAVDLIGDNNILTAGSSIGIPANGIETTFNILDASSTNTGSIVLNETDIITLLDIDTANGLITIIAGNTITALDVQSLNDIGGNNVTLTANTGDVLVDFVSAGILANNLTITATTGNIRDFNGDGAVDLQANAAILTAAGDIGGNLTGNLDTTFNTLNATSTVFGPVYINETDDIRLINVTTANGWIDTLAGGGIIAVNVVSQTDSQFNSIKLISVAGNIEVGLVSAGTSFGDVLIWAKNGAVDEYVIEDPVADIVADDLILFASSGIGDNREIELSVRSFTVAAINGNISLGNITPFNVTINSISTVNGNIKFTQSGGADLTVLNASTGVGNITFNVQDNQDLYMYNLIAGGNTTLIADEIDLLGGPLSIQSRFNTGILTMRPNDPSLTTHVYSPVDRTVFRDSNVLEIGWQDIRAFEFSYLKFVVGNILTNQNPIAIEYLSQINTVLLAFVGFTDSDVFDDAEVDELIFNFSGIMNTNISFLKGELNRNNFVDAGGLVIEAITLPFVFNDDDSLGDPLYTFNGDSNAQNGDDTNENSDETPKKSKIKNTDEKSEDNLNGNGEGGENSQPDDTTFNQFEGSDELAHEAAPSLLSVEGMASTLTMVAMTVGQVVAGIFRK